LEFDWLVKLIILILFLAASAFFSGSEVALFSLDKRKIKKHFKSHSLKLKYIDSLLEKPRRLLVTILIGNTVFNVAASIVAVTIAIEVAPLIGIPQELAITIQIILLTVVILLFSELLPKVIASNNPVSFASFIVIPLYWIRVIIYPVVEIITELILLTRRLLPGEKRRSILSKEEITDLTEIGQEKGTLEEEEHEMITINSTGHSRFPLYKEDLDQITGILYAKDILPYLDGSKTNKHLDLSKIVRKPMFVPKAKKINDLLRDFQSQKTHIAVVVVLLPSKYGRISFAYKMPVI
jgi:CBS domain containing-hemolysin-like protein